MKMQQLKIYVHQFGMFLAAVVVFSTATMESNAQNGRFTFKLDQHETILSDQATLEDLQYFIDKGLVDPDDPQVAQELERVEFQQMMSDLNSKCTLISSAMELRTRPTISIGNGLEFPNSDDLDPSTSQKNIIGFTIELGSTANQYNFGLHKWNNLPAVPLVVPDNVTFSSAILDGGNKLSISFGNGGLQPGQMSALQISLTEQNPAPGSPLPFMDEFFSNDSVLTVKFQDPTTMAIVDTGPFPFVNFLQYSIELKKQVAGPLQHLGDFLDSYMINNPGVVVPEPSSIALLMSSLGSYFLLGRRHAA